MNSKTQFLGQTELSKWWSAVVADPRFDRVLLHASGMAFDSGLNDVERNGALKFREMLQTLPVPEEKSQQISGPRLDHDFDTVRKILEPKTVPKKRSL